nr:lachesin-like isoform X1 [Nomia melanderi]
MRTRLLVKTQSFCSVSQVGWLRMEDQTILSMGQQKVTHSPRFLVTLENAKTKNQSQSRDEEEATSRLHIRQLREADRGCYMCQLNTKPMLSQLGCVDVLVPPDILSSGTSEGEVSVQEGENATLSCNASGRPPPRVHWRRENPLISGVNQSGEKLEFTRVNRKQMGAYLCIASNEVPPAVSKRVSLRVNFPPSVKASNDFLSSPLNTNVSLICLIEAYPKTINLWTKQGQVIMSGGRYEINERGDPNEEWKTTIELKIKRLEKNDTGAYTCSASSSMGTARAVFRVHEYEQETPTTRASSPANAKKPSKAKSKFAQASTINRVFHQMSTPAMQKSTARIVHGKQRSTTTTPDPRAPFIKDENLFKSREKPNAAGNSRADATPPIDARICAFCMILYLSLR